MPINSAWPGSARELLEKRYECFVKGNVDFIIESHHPETKEQIDRASIEAWSTGSEWQGLTIESEKPEGPDKYLITFTVRYRRAAETVNHRENAEFRKSDDGRWYYYDSVFPKPETLRREGDKVGRNDPCNCGSGKKFKKCHGVAA